MTNPINGVGVTEKDWKKALEILGFESVAGMPASALPLFNRIHEALSAQRRQIMTEAQAMADMIEAIHKNPGSAGIVQWATEEALDRWNRFKESQ